MKVQLKNKLDMGKWEWEKGTVLCAKTDPLYKHRFLILWEEDNTEKCAMMIGWNEVEVIEK